MMTDDKQTETSHEPAPKQTDKQTNMQTDISADAEQHSLEQHSLEQNALSELWQIAGQDGVEDIAPPLASSLPSRLPSSTLPRLPKRNSLSPADKRTKQRHNQRKLQGKFGGSKQQYYDQMAISKLLSSMVALLLLVSAILYVAVQFINLPYDGRIIAMPNITSQRAQQAGIIAQQPVKIGQRLNNNAPVISLYPSTLRAIDNRAASQLAKVRLQLSRLETQKLGQLMWVLPDDLRARAFQDDDFTKFVLAQQKKFAKYYDALDEYGAEIYSQRQRLQNRIKDARQAIAGLKQEHSNINHRLTQVAGQERQVLLREVTYIKGDILDTTALIEKFTRELDELQPRLRRLIRKRAEALTPELTALQQRHQQLLAKLAISDSVVVRAQVGGQLVELAGQNVGDAVQAGDILYRVARADNQNMLLQISASLALRPYLENGNESRLWMKNRVGDNASHKLRLLKIETIDAQQIQVTYQISITNLFETFGRLPNKDDILSLQIQDAPLQPRLRGLWQRAQEKRRFATDGQATNNRLPFFNQHNFTAFQQETTNVQGFTDWLIVQLTKISTQFIPAKDE